MATGLATMLPICIIYWLLRLPLVLDVQTMGLGFVLSGPGWGSGQFTSLPYCVWWSWYEGFSKVAESRWQWGNAESFFGFYVFHHFSQSGSEARLKLGRPWAGIRSPGKSLFSEWGGGKSEGFTMPAESGRPWWWAVFYGFFCVPSFWPGRWYI